MLVYAFINVSLSSVVLDPAAQNGEVVTVEITFTGEKFDEVKINDRIES